MRNVRHATSMRQANEDYSAFDQASGRGGNLTPLQRRYARWWVAVRNYQLGRTPMESAAFGFKGRHVRGKVVPLGPKSRIRTIDSLSFLSIVPLDRRLLSGDEQQNRYRLHYNEQVGYLQDGDVCFGGKFVGKRVDSAEHRQAALDKRPLQDHQIYAQIDYAPTQLSEQLAEAVGITADASHIKAPFYGNFAVVRDDLFVRLTIEGHDVYRFRKQDAERVTILAVPGEVKAGDVLASLTEAVSYLAAEPWASHPDTRACRPLIDSIEGDSLSATHCVPQLTFAMASLENMLALDEGEATFLPSPEDCWPVVMVNIPAATFRSKRQFGWEPNAEFKAALLEAVSPDAVATTDTENLFALRSPCVGRVTAIVRHDGYKIVHIERAEDGKEVTVSAPVCAEFHDNLDQVFENQVIGEYVQRCYYATYEQLTEAAQGCIVKIEDDFLDGLTILSGETNLVGDGVLLDERLAGALREQCEGRLIDTEPLFPFIEEKYGIAILPAVRFDIYKHGLQRRVNGIRYDVTPLGGAFKDIAERIADRGARVNAFDQRPPRRNSRRRADRQTKEKQN